MIQKDFKYDIINRGIFAHQKIKINYSEKCLIFKRFNLVYQYTFSLKEYLYYPYRRGIQLTYFLIFKEIETILFSEQLPYMGEYNITKIIDGLFVSDHFVPFDISFLRGNKIISVVGWTNDSQIVYSQDEDIKCITLPKNNTDVKFPSFAQLEQCFKFLEIIHQQMLCGLIYSQSELQGSLIAIMYLMYRYSWDCNTAFSFVRNKMQVFQISDEAIDQLEKYQAELETVYSRKLNHILWDYQFLVNYHSQFDEEALIITTIKNKLRPLNTKNSKPSQSKKKPRIRWQDQIRPSSAAKIGSTANLRRSSLNKNKSGQIIPQPITAFQNQANNKDLQLLYQSISFKQTPTVKGSSSKKNQKQINIQEDFDFLQLKEMSRTNFNDKKYMSSKLRRRTSLKPNKPLVKSQSSSNLQNINTLVGIYSNQFRPNSGKSTGLSRSGSGQLFWNSLKSNNKLVFGNA